VPQIEVTFEIDSNGIVNVSAQDKMTGLEQAMTITPSSGLTPAEIERLIMEAEVSAERDRDERELINQRNRLDTLLRNARKAMAEIGRGFPLEFQQEVNGKLNEAEETLASNDLTEIHSVIIKVEEVSSKITEAMLTAV
jgi:molecular chaperone DnaK